MHGQNKLPYFKDLGGYGLVAEEEDSIFGFVWALIAEDSCTALIDYFFVKEDRRDCGVMPMLLMSRMLVDLTKKGKEDIVGVIKLGIPHSDSLARLYQTMGMDVTPAYLMTGKTTPIVNHLMKKINQVKQ